MTDDTLLRKTGVQRRMQCSGNIAHIVVEAFVTVEQLIDAIESDEPLTDCDGIGPSTVDVIENWWDDRFDREVQMPDSTVTRQSSKSASIELHHSWDDALEETR